MFDKEFLEEAAKSPVLGPHYFDARKVMKRFVAKFEADQLKPLVEKAADNFRERLWSDVEDYLFSDAETNLQGEVWRMVDDCVEALLGGNDWALERFLLADRYDVVKTRAALVRMIPEDLQSAYARDLEKKIEDLEKRNQILEKYR